MKRFINILLAVVLIMPEIAMASFNFHSLYFGASVGIKHNGFKSGFGDNLFRATQPTAQIFAGIGLLPNVDLEFDLEKTISYSRTSNIGPGIYFLGDAMLPNTPTRSIKSDSKYMGMGVKLFYKFNLFKIENFNFLIGAGIKRAKVKLTSQNLYNMKTFNLRDNNSKNLLTLSTGVEYMLNKVCGLRGLVSWENTSKLQPSLNQSGLNYMAQFKNSISYTLGLIARF